MNELESTRAKLKCLEMVAGTDLKWWEVVKLRGFVRDGGVDFSADKEEYEFALGIVEGKPVWAGDELYYKGVQEAVGEGMNLYLPDWSWNPPKQKTVMVEFTVITAKLFETKYPKTALYFKPEILVADAIRKALKEMK